MSGINTALGDLTPESDSVEVMRRRLEAAAKEERETHDPCLIELRPFREALQKTVTAADLVGLALPPREWLIEPLLFRGQLAMIYARAGVGKTWLALTLSIAASQGVKLFGPFAAPKPVEVLYIDGEMPAREMQDRLSALKIASAGRLHILSSDLLSQQEEATPNLSDPKWREALLIHMREHPGIRLLVLDNISALTPGMNEQERKDWDGVNQWLMSLRRMGLTVLLIHHAGKGGDQRGTSAREDQLDLVLKLTRVESRKVPTLRVDYQKARSLSGEQKKSFLMEIVMDESGTVVLQHKAISQDRLSQVAFLTSLGHSQKEIAEAVQVSQGQVSKLVQRARKDGLLDGDRLTEWGESLCAGMDDECD